MTLREIAAGKVTIDNVDELPGVLDEDEMTNENAEESVISQDV